MQLLIYRGRKFELVFLAFVADLKEVSKVVVTYYISTDDIITIFFFFDDHATTPTPRLFIYHDILFGR